MVVASAVAGQARDAARDVRYAPAPDWVIAPPSASDAPLSPGAPMRVIYVDQQVRLVPGGNESYSAYRFKVLAPEALAVGNVTVAWSPGSDVLTVHRLQIIRDGKPIDVLATQKFAILQRESNLEQSMLDGQLTAALQASGLQVGDELDFAFTRASRDAAWGERPQAACNSRSWGCVARGGGGCSSRTGSMWSSRRSAICPRRPSRGRGR